MSSHHGSSKPPSRSSSTSSKAIRAQYAAEAAAAKLKIKQEEAAIAREATLSKIQSQHRIELLKDEQRLTELRCQTFDQVMAEMDEIIEDNSKLLHNANLSSNDRVRQYLDNSIKHEPTGGTTASADVNLINLGPSLAGVTTSTVVSSAATNDLMSQNVNCVTSSSSTLPHIHQSGAVSFTTSSSVTTTIPGTSLHSIHQTATGQCNQPYYVSSGGLPMTVNSTMHKAHLSKSTIPTPISVATPNPGSSEVVGPNTLLDISAQFEHIMSDYASTNLKVAETLAKCQLPPLAVDKFNGDATLYTRWKRNTLSQLASVQSVTERLTRLATYVEGEAAEIVQQYADRFPNRAHLAYEQAWNVLDYRFGRPSVLADALLKKVSKPKFEGNLNKAIRKFADLCISTSLQIGHLPGLQVLNFPMYLQPITELLPRFCRKEWVNYAYKIIKSEGCEYPNFEQFSQFMDNVADKVCDPNLKINLDDFTATTKTARLAQATASDPPETGSYEQQANTVAMETNTADSTTATSRGKSKNFCPAHPNLQNSHQLSKCRLFRSMNVEDQCNIFHNNKAICRSCLAYGHQSSDCKSSDVKCDRPNCTRRHYGFLHDACERLQGQIPSTNAYSAKSALPSNAICPAQLALSSSSGEDLKPLTVLFDTGSNVSLVSTDACERLGLSRTESNIELDVEVVGGDKLKITAHAYSVPLYRQTGEYMSSITAYGMDNIGSKLPAVKLDQISKIFGLPPEAMDQLTYPSGCIDLLLGTDNAQFMPRHISTINGLILAETPIGYLVYGHHDSFRDTPRTAAAKATVRPSDLRMDLVPSLFATDVLGISCVPKCGGCACKKCNVDGSKITPSERYEYEQIKNSMTLENGVITASYPYVRNIDELPDNYQLALNRLVRTERSLAKDPERASAYRQQIDDMITRGVMRKLTPAEESEWKGAVQYLPHNDVQKPDSASTPVRLVLDPSAEYRGKSVNQFWGRGPSLLNDPIGILIRFRENPTAFAGDISKMYWCVHTRPQEWHLHRVLWRDLDASRPPDKYIIVRNSFGSGPAGCVAIAAKNFLAEQNQGEYPGAADVIVNQAFVDDMVDSVPTLADAKRLTSEIDHILSLGSFKVKKWTIVNVEEHSPPQTGDGVITLSSEESVLGISWSTQTDEFFFTVHLNFSRKRKKVRTGPDLQPGQIFDTALVPVLTKRNIMSQVHSLYDPLGLISPFLVELKFALGKLWRIKEEIDWDTPIPSDHDAHWRKLLDLFFSLPDLRFPRVLRPSCAIEPPILLAFSDSSMIAYCAVLYIRWTLSNGEIFARLITAKSRMWPIEPDDYLSVARGELMGVLLAKRLAATVIKECRFQFSEILYIMDSEICLAQINTDSHEFNVWTGNRVAEIRTGTELTQFWFTNSENNPCADLCSRGTQDTLLMDKDTVWQRGPTWVYTARHDWPILQNVKPTNPVPDLRIESLTRRAMSAMAQSVDSLSQPPKPDCATVPQPTSTERDADIITDPNRSHDSLQHVPRVIRPIQCCVLTAMQRLGEGSPASSPIPEARMDIAKFTLDQEEFIASLIDLSRHDNLENWLAITVRILKACSWKAGDGCFFKFVIEPDVIPAVERELARWFWIRQAQKLLSDAMKHGKYKSLTPFLDENGLIRINGRSSATSSYQPILMPRNHPFSRLIVVSVHRRGHGGAVATAARVRGEYHILKLRQLAIAVRKDCQLCTLKERKLLSVPMAPLPSTRQLPSFPFANCSCDLFGPIFIKIDGRVSRNRSINDEKYKAYGIIFTCLATRSVHIDVMQGQDTDAFLLAFRRFVTIRGQPKTMWSDNGGQLVAADQELRTIVDGFDITKLRQYGAENGMLWTFTSPGSPWQNGVSESLIKSVKLSMKATIPNKRLTIMELQTVLYETAELLNERPINLGHSSSSGADYDAETNSYLCPNQLLLGRASVRIPAGPFQSVPLSHKNRLLANQAIVTEWWTRWQRDYVPTLVSQTKWFKSDRLVRVGDIVQVRDLNPIRGQWGIAEIVEIKPSADQIPRNVRVQYKTPYPGKDYRPTSFRTQWRDVKNLSLLLPVEARSELNHEAKAFEPHQS